MKDSPIKTTENPVTPKTGDLYKPLAWLGIGILGIGLMAASIFIGRKKKCR